jgi:hypothetical protein
VRIADFKKLFSWLPGFLIRFSVVF